MNKKAFIPISALMVAMLLALVAAMTPFVAGPKIAYAQASANADLASLAVVGAPSGTVYTGGELAPTFSDATTEYTVRTNFNDSGVTVTATANDNDATIKINGQTPNTSNEVGVSIGAGRTTAISIVVTAAAGNTKTYTVKAYRNRSTLSNNANLNSLGLAGVSLSPAFSSSNTSYKARVQDNEVTVSYGLSDTAGAASAALTVADGGSDDDPNDMDVPLGAEAATTTITVTVTAEDGDATKAYNIEVYRIRANPSTDATLETLTLSPDTSSITGYTFAPATAMYDLTVDNDIAYVTVAPEATDEGAHFAINPRTDSRPAVLGHQINLRAGIDTTITVTVTAEDPSATETYTLKIYKRRPDTATNPAIDDATLRSLSVSMGTLTPAFSSSTKTYDVQVGSGVEKVTVSYTPTNNLGGVTVVGAALTGVGTTSIAPVYDPAKNEVTLDGPGVRTDITLTVTPENGDTSDNDVYTIRVYRLRALPSADASLQTLTVTGASELTLSPTFTASTLSKEPHKTTAPFSDTSVTVAADPTTKDTGATAEITPTDADTSMTGHQVALTAGAETMITVMVTAEDRVTTATYTVIVYRQRADMSDDATLSALSLSDGTLSPAFMSDRMAYDARVATDVDKVSVSYTPTDNAGGVNVMVTALDDANTSLAVSDDEVTLAAAGGTATITLAVTAEDSSSESYTIAVYRENTNRNIDATLTAFSIQDVNPVSAADSDNNGIAEACGPNDARVMCDLDADSMPIIVDYRVRTVSIIATANDQLGAVVDIVSPADKNPSTPRHDIDLTAGQVTEIEVMVTAEDTSVTKTYMASVYRKKLVPSDDATLSSLDLSGATLMPEFASDEMEYMADVANSTTHVTVSATTTDDAGGARVAYGSGAGTEASPFMSVMDADEDMDGHQVALGVAGTDTDITVEVTAEDGTKDHYMIEVTRAEEVSTNAKLKSLKLMHGGEEISLLTAKYWWNTLDCPQMKAVVGSGEVEGDMATYCVMYDDLSAAGKMKVDEVFAMSVEDAWNGIGCMLMKQAVGMDDQAFCAMYDGLGADQMMTVYEVYRPSTFSVMVGSGVDMTNVMAEPAHVAASVSGDTGMQDLMPGENTITVKVTAEDEDTMKTYTVMVTREALTDEARLLALYDRNGSGRINDRELGRAIVDFSNNRLSEADMGRLIVMWTRTRS